MGPIEEISQKHSLYHYHTIKQGPTLHRINSVCTMLFEIDQSKIIVIYKKYMYI